jgi:hypothetical protein
MVAEKSHGSPVKTSVPRELYMAIVRLQAAENLDWDEACLRAVDLLNKNGGEFKHATELEAQRVYKSRFMSELNKSRKTIYKMGYNEAMQIDRFTIPCSICGKPMQFTSRDPKWEEQKLILNNAFKNVCHTNCVKK